MENPEEDAILNRWASQERALVPTTQASGQSNKRRRIVEGPTKANTAITLTDIEIRQAKMHLASDTVVLDDS